MLIFDSRMTLRGGFGKDGVFFKEWEEINGTGRPTVDTPVNDRVVRPLMTGEILKQVQDDDEGRIQ